MAIVRNAANMIRKGRVGDATYYVSKGQQVVRQARNDSNYGETARRSEAQQVRRIMWANLVNFYKVSADWMPAAFETKARAQTDYNKFMSVNMANARISLTKAQAAAGACVVDGYLVTQGSLPSVEIARAADAWYTNIGLGDLQITADTTNAELTAALVANNANIQEGMQISFVSYQQSWDAMDIPRVICRLYEITLSLSNQSKVRNYLPDFCSTSVNGMLGTSSNISKGGFAYIVSDKRAGRVRVSTQYLQVYNSEAIVLFTSEMQRRQAIVSYGLDTEVILSPTGTTEQEPEPQPNHIDAIADSTRRYKSGSYFGTLSERMGQSVVVYFSNLIRSTTAQYRVRYGSGSITAVYDVDSVSGSVIEMTFPTTEWEGRTEAIIAIIIVLEDGSQFEINFSNEPLDPSV